MNYGTGIETERGTEPQPPDAELLRNPGAAELPHAPQIEGAAAVGSGATLEHFVPERSLFADTINFKSLQQFWCNLKKVGRMSYEPIAGDSDIFVKKVFPQGLTANAEPRAERNHEGQGKLCVIGSLFAPLLESAFGGYPVAVAD